MSVPVTAIGTTRLLLPGIHSSTPLHYQLSSAQLEKDTLKRGEGILSDSGALVINTGKFTGRSPKDKYIVKDKITAELIDWNEFNNPIDEQHYQIIESGMFSYLNNRKELWVRDAYACADQRFRLNIRVCCENPWTNLFCYNMFLRPEEEESEQFNPDWYIYSAPGLKLNASECGIRAENATIVNFKNKTILIAGSGYTGETKKAIFSVLNFLLPKRGILSMHCAANRGSNGDTAVFFGLSGTGKTTLSADPLRALIGDDEHGWSDDGIFNFEGGCYAKTIDLKKEKEPAIFSAIRPGALLENVGFIKGSNRVNFSDRTITENTRVSYPLHFIEDALQPAIGAVPKHIFFLTCDASGVLPPLSKLNAGQAMYQFISGYTAKIAGTETGVTEPKPTFSACFGAPFMPLHPGKYASLLGKKIRQHDVSIWLINTGWTGGPFGIGKRIDLNDTRNLISAVLENKLKDIQWMKHPVFGVAVPTTCPDVSSTLLDPRSTWADKAAYDMAAIKLAKLFIANFSKYSEGICLEVMDAGPQA